MTTDRTALKKFWADKEVADQALAKTQADRRIKLDLLRKAAQLGISVLSRDVAKPAAPGPKVIDENKMTKAEIVKARYENFIAAKAAEAPAFVYEAGALKKEEPMVIVKPPEANLAKAERGSAAHKAPQQRAIENTMTKAEAAKKKVKDFWAQKDASEPGFTSEE